MRIERKDQIWNIGHVESRRFCDQLDFGVEADITQASGLEAWVNRDAINWEQE